MYLPHTWVPAQDPVVFGATQQQFRVSLAPGDRENSPKIDQKEISHISYPVHSPTLSPRKQQKCCLSSEMLVLISTLNQIHLRTKQA